VLVCPAIVWPSVELTALEPTTGSPVPLAGSVLSFSSGSAMDAPDTRPAALGTSNQYTTFGFIGRVVIHLAQMGYTAFDTAVVVPDTGYCRNPILQHVTARLTRQP
jgi:hypothetical protein